MGWYLLDTVVAVLQFKGLHSLFCIRMLLKVDLLCLSYDFHFLTHCFCFPGFMEFKISFHTLLALMELYLSLVSKLSSYLRQNVVYSCIDTLFIHASNFMGDPKTCQCLWRLNIKNISKVVFVICTQSNSNVPKSPASLLCSFPVQLGLKFFSFNASGFVAGCGAKSDFSKTEKLCHFLTN